MIAIRMAKTRADLNLARKIFKKAFANWPHSQQTFSYYLARINKDRLKHHELLLAYVNNKPVGMLSFAYHTYIFSRAIFLENVGTLSGFQGKGIATALIEKFLQLGKAKNLRRAFSATWPENEASIKLHKRLGFKYCGKIAKVSSEKEDWIFMSKKL